MLGVDQVVVCAKNSAPLSPVVSKASSGAMELMNIYSTNNLMRFLDACQEQGWQVVGTSLDDTAVELTRMTLDQPTILVLGNEGVGIRKNILNRCTQLVKIPMGTLETNPVVRKHVDSLNVSVTGGIILHHIVGHKRHPILG